MTTRTDDTRLNPMNWDNLIDFQSQVLDPMTADELWEKALMDDNFVVREFCLGELRARQEKAVDVGERLLRLLLRYVKLESDLFMGNDEVEFVKSLIDLPQIEDWEVWYYRLNPDDDDFRPAIRECMGFGGASE